MTSISGLGTFWAAVLFVAGLVAAFVAVWGAYHDFALEKKRQPIYFAKLVVSSLAAMILIGGAVVGTRGTTSPAAIMPSSVPSVAVTVIRSRTSPPKPVTYNHSQPIKKSAAVRMPRLSPTPFPVRAAQQSPLKSVAVEFATSVMQYCASEQSTDAEAERLFYPSLTIIVGRLNAKGLESLHVSETWVSSGTQDCYMLKEEAASINALAQRLK